jgi:hypothetical protein
MPTRASDSSKFTRWDEDSLRGRIQTHPENGLGRRRHDRPPRTNHPSAALGREQDFGSDGRGFESLRARHTNQWVARARSSPRRQRPRSLSGVACDSRCVRCPARRPAASDARPDRLSNFRCPRPAHFYRPSASCVRFVAPQVPVAPPREACSPLPGGVASTRGPVSDRPTSPSIGSHPVDAASSI